MKRLVIGAGLLFSMAAVAQPAPPPDELVLIPRAVAQGAASWIMNPDATSAVRLYAAMTACLRDNPSGGVITRSGQDFCTDVTAAIDARDKEITDLKKQAADAKAALDKAVADQKATDEKAAIDQVTEAKRMMQARIDLLEKGK